MNETTRRTMVNKTNLSIDDLWARLRRLEGEEFLTKREKPFTYEISGKVLRPSRARYNLSQSEFQKALVLVPCEGPGAMNRSIRGPAYVWALLHDERVRRGEW